ncbi:MAG: SUMF1/EgtB/PvdO family nonheme iron enzyme [Parachlamydiaceae bacterium]|nr:SUMF1/EgtB/PvdO family nonheme iron enzyme [Parachlamydiaceae bacterium]
MIESRIQEARILGDYTLIKQIGHGSLGTVFLAEHLFMKRQFILKLLPEELSVDRAFIQRFEEEVGALAALDHPNIVKIHNISFSQGQYFLVTDCIVDSLGETTNLAQHIMGRSQRFGEEELYDVLLQIADALDYAHSKKIGKKPAVHRGIKLNNILVGQGKNCIDVYLSDFGLSKIVGVGAVLTRTYKIVADALGAGASVAAAKIGHDSYPFPPIDHLKLAPLHASFLQNFAFLAPEQKRLDSTHDVDAKADVYAFGVLTYFLLTGEFPDGNFDLPSYHRSDLTCDWDSLVEECLRTDPNRRPELLIPLLGGIHKIKAEPIPAPVGVSVSAAASVALPPASLVSKEKEVITPVVAPVTAPPEQQHVSSNETAQLRPVIHRTSLEIPQVDPDPGAIFQLELGVKQYTPELRDTKNIKPLQTEMVVLNGGIFWRGSNDDNRDEMPRHQVNLNSFAIDKHPVTNEQFVRFLDVMGGEKDNNHQDIIRLKDSRIKRSGGKLSIESGYGKHPVVGVTWYGSVAYARWVGKRLPTEAEWEIAARGEVENALYPTGGDIEKTQANFFSSDTIAVMSYAPNGYGLYDMAGNVYEWCHDWYGYNYYETSVQEPDAPAGPWQGVYRVLRGGCWKSLKEDLRCSRRHRNNPGTVNSTYGFRCAADVE